MSNAAKYSKASRIRCCLKRTENALQLTIEDNGTGFEMGDGFQTKTGGKGLGLFSMRERAELSGGSLTIKSSSGRGTLIQATWELGDKLNNQNKDLF